MPEPVQLPRTDDPFAALRAGVDAHRQLTDAARQVGVELSQQPPVNLSPTEDQP